MIFIKNFYCNSQGSGSKTSLIHDVRSVLRESKVPAGLVTIYAPMGKAGVTAASKKEIDEEGLSPVSRSLTLPFNQGELLLDPWQEVFLVDYDSSSRRREVTVHVMGDQAAAPAGPGGRPPAPRGAPGPGKPLAKIPLQKKMVKA